MREYYDVPESISSDKIIGKQYSLSAGMYKKIIINNPDVLSMKDYLDDKKPYDKGIEPGTDNYISTSHTQLLRTRSLQSEFFLPYLKGSAIVAFNPKLYSRPTYELPYILMSKDSNVGESAMITTESLQDFMFSSGIVKLNLKNKSDIYYLFSFMKHPIFVKQLIAMSPKGSTITHAGERWLDCLIPQGKDSEIEELSMLTKTVLDYERLIREKDQKIFEMIDNELNQHRNSDAPEEADIKDIRNLGRLDAAVFSREYVEKIGLITGYSKGYKTPSESGFEIIPGPSLEVKIIKARVDSEYYRKGYHQLVTPSDISEFGTVLRERYLGTPKKMPILQSGDIIVGEAGFQKGRSTMITEDMKYPTTNAHGLIVRRKDLDACKSVFFRCIFDWYRKQRLIDLMAVGGSGGHFSPSYFEYIRIPEFPEQLRQEITNLYYSSDSDDNILGLASKIKNIKKRITQIQDEIIDRK